MQFFFISSTQDRMAISIIAQRNEEKEQTRYTQK